MGKQIARCDGLAQIARCDGLAQIVRCHGLASNEMSCVSR